MRTTTTCGVCSCSVPFYYHDGRQCYECWLADLTRPRRIITADVRAKPAAELAGILAPRPSLADGLTAQQRRIVGLILAGHTLSGAGREMGLKRAAASRLLGRVLARLRADVNISEQPPASATDAREAA